MFAQVRHLLVAKIRHTKKPVASLADLRGLKLSYVEGSGRQVYLIEALNRGGVALDQVELVPLRVADLPDAIRSGAVDVAVLQEPHVTRLKNQTTRLFSSTITAIYESGDKTAILNRSIADKAVLWWHAKHPEQAALWRSTVTLSEQFYAEVIEHPEPLVVTVSMRYDYFVLQ